MPVTVFTQPWKPFSEMTAYEREAHEYEVAVDYLIDEAPFVPLLELAQGLVEDTEEFGQAASLRMAEVLRRRASASSLGPSAKRPLTAPPTGPKPPPIRSRPWCAAGHGLTDLREVLAAYRCGLVPCRLNWLAERHPAGRPLGTYLHDEKASVVVSCECGELKPKRYAVRAFAKAVVAGEGTAALAWPLQPVREGPVTLPWRMIRGVCPACRERRWRILLFKSSLRTF